MVYDPVVGKTLLIGGDFVGSRGALPGDAWLWDGTNWSQLAGAPHFGVVATAYDEAGRVVVVYGSSGSASVTWTWDGVAWTKQTPAHLPPPRDYTQMCYDSNNHVAVLFGGVAEGVPAFGDTWEWNGIDWSESHPSTSPPARYGGALICGGGRVVLVGGADVGRGPFGGVWEWDGQNWTQVVTSHSPAPLEYPAGVFDGSRYVLLLGVGASLPVTSEVWSFDGTDWTAVSVS